MEEAPLSDETSDCHAQLVVSTVAAPIFPRDGREERGPGPQACRPSVWEFAAPAASARAPASREEGGGRWGSRDGETWARVKWWSS